MVAEVFRPAANSHRNYLENVGFGFLSLQRGRREEFV
jgi:hypothetical protein